MRILILFPFFLSAYLLNGQNNLHLFSGTGKPFRVLLNDKYITAAPQTDVILQKMTSDTVRLKLDFEGRRYGATFYLLNKGRHTRHQQFSYKIEPAKEKLEVIYMGMDSVSRSERNLVPDNPFPVKQ